jgi:hypothetical protein
MINVKTEVLTALQGDSALVALLGGSYIYQIRAPSGLAKYVTFFELTNFDSEFADDTAVASEIHLQVDVWVVGGSTSAIADQVDTTMKTLGFKRTGGADLYEEDTNIYHKALRYATEREI